jgi:hypothetical protein
MDLHHKDSSVVLTLLLLVLAVIVGYFILYPSRPASETKTPSASSVKTTPATSSNPSNSVAVTNATAEKNLPTGFPSIIPVEKANITESYKAVYKNHNNATQYTISYTSKSSVAALWDTYADFLRKEGYVLDKLATDKNLGTISGTKGDNTLSVVLSRHDKVSLVQLNLLYR